MNYCIIKNNNKIKEYFVTFTVFGGKPVFNKKISMCRNFDNKASANELLKTISYYLPLINLKIEEVEE